MAELFHWPDEFVQHVLNVVGNDKRLPLALLQQRLQHEDDDPILTLGILRDAAQKRMTPEEIVIAFNAGEPQKVFEDALAALQRSSLVTNGIRILRNHGIL